MIWMPFSLRAHAARSTVWKKIYCRKMRKSISSAQLGSVTSCERLRPAVADVLLRPHIDRRVVIFLLLERHEQRVIGQPFAVLLGEVRDSCLHLGRDARIRLAEQRPARIGELLEVRRIGRSGKVAGAHLIRRQQTVLCEQVHVDQIRVARRRREALVRRVAEAGMTERQHLPVGLVRGREEVDRIRRPSCPSCRHRAARAARSRAQARRWNV